ncbi:MAG: hypothetical protein Q4E17_05665 [Synergistes sp.]|nr:hypothetical protein [Synergistes sp.]
MPNFKIFVPFAPAALAGAFDTVRGSKVYFTSLSDEDALVFERSLPDCAGYSVVRSSALCNVAPSVIECAEKLGGIDKIFFAPALTTRGSLFLDLDEESFVSHTEAFTALFMVCKCALPYMMGGREPEVLIELPHETENIISGVYCAAVEKLAKDMNNELAEWGVNVKIIR